MMKSAITFHYIVFFDWHRYPESLVNVKLWNFDGYRNSWEKNLYSFFLWTHACYNHFDISCNIFEMQVSQVVHSSAEHCIRLLLCKYLPHKEYLEFSQVPSTTLLSLLNQLIDENNDRCSEKRKKLIWSTIQPFWN